MNPIQVRLMTEADEAFVYRLFSLVCDEQQGLAYLPESQREPLVQMQYRARAQSYKAAYPEAMYQIIEFEGQPAGYHVVAEQDEQIVLVDVAVLPEFRRRGICTHMLQMYRTKAQQEGKVSVLHVFKMNPAQHLYARLGFEIVQDCGMQWTMKGG